jgi:hypothetical protein
MSANEWIAPAFAIIGAVVGAVVGAAISYIVQTKTQRREYSIKIAETVYIPLYSAVNAIKSLLEKESFERISFETWSEFQRDPRYLQVRPDKFRQQLDDFLKKVNDYDGDVIRLIYEIFPDIVQKASVKAFNLIPKGEILINVEYKQPNGKSDRAQYTPVPCLRARKPPRDILMEWFPDSEIVSLTVRLALSETIVRPNVSTQQPPTEFDELKFNEFWKSCLELENENEIFKRTLQKQSELLRESKIIFNELIKRINVITEV